MGVREDPKALQAVVVARQLVLEGVENTDAIRRLRAEVSGAVLRRAARDTVALSRESFPWPRIHHLLEAAGGQIELRDRSEAEAALEEGLAQLLTVSASTAFAILAQRLPALIDLESRARSINDDPTLTVGRKPWHAGADPATLRLLALKPLRSEVALTVGPKSNNPDALLTSKLVQEIVNNHLSDVVGVNAHDDPT